jgi:formiminotetrahydrofolate cyclodeaminase
VVAAYRMAKGTDGEKAARTQAIQGAMRDAVEAPLAVMRACRAALEQVAAIERHGNPNAASDVQVGQGLLTAGLNGARANVEVNLSSIKDAGYVEQVRREI